MWHIKCIKIFFVKLLKFNINCEFFMKNKKRFKKYLNLLGCCAFVALSGFSAIFNVERIDNVKAYEETIVNGQNINLGNYSSPLYVVNNRM